MGGNPGNPPDKYALLKLTGVMADDLTAINVFADQGFRFVAELSTGETATDFPIKYVLMGNYKENK